MEGEVAGKRVRVRNMELPKDLKCEGDGSSDDDDDDEEHIDTDDVDNDDGQVPDVVVAEDIIPGLCILEWKHFRRLVRSLSCTFGEIFPDWNWDLHLWFYTVP